MQWNDIAIKSAKYGWARIIKIKTGGGWAGEIKFFKRNAAYNAGATAGNLRNKRIFISGSPTGVLILINSIKHLPQTNEFL